MVARSSSHRSDIAASWSRRRFIQSTGTAFAALVASGCTARGLAGPGSSVGAQMADIYGPLISDPNGLIDLPAGFSYRVISRLGDAMDDGGTVPDKADGMGCFDLGGGKIALVRNHELKPGDKAGAQLSSGYGKGPDGTVFPGGTTNIVLDAETLAVERQLRTLAGTIRNCAGGTTPWGSWLTCEEPGEQGLRLKNHGYVFEVPADATAMVDPVPLKALGRFNHEAACVDPRTGFVYMTEDREDSLLYRFLPTDGLKAGRLDALVIDGVADARNWDAGQIASGEWHTASWITLDNVDAPDDDLRLRGAAKGATIFARGEGIHMGEGELYFCCTSGGAAKLGQVFRLQPQFDGSPGRAQLFFESESKAQFNYGDNLVVAPNGHLIVCEDQYTIVVDNRLIGITPQGAPYVFGRLDMQTELAGGCFSPDGKWFFVNAYSPTVTLAITGPWVS